MGLLEQLQWHLSIGLHHRSHGVLLGGVINGVDIDTITTIVSLGGERNGER